MRCPACSQTNRPGALYCADCGAALPGQVSLTGADLVLGGILFLICFAGGAFAAFWSFMGAGGLADWIYPTQLAHPQEFTPTPSEGVAYLIEFFVFAALVVWWFWSGQMRKISPVARAAVYGLLIGFGGLLMLCMPAAWSSAVNK